MNTFISCDWGTSAFRLRWIDADTASVLAEIKTAQGIAATYNEWNSHHQQTNRLSFYKAIIANGVKALEQQCHQSLADITIVISGMASSTIGMLELPYKELPFHLNGSDIMTHVVTHSTEFKHSLLFISGAKTNDDVMRGEETKLLGCEINDEQETQLLVMPGTHSKHVTIKRGQVTNFKTYMTGELFDLLSTKSVLAASVEKVKEQPEKDDTAFFVKGVAEAVNNNVLNSLFHVRTYRLFNYQTSQQNYHYLSGLLIGSELKELLVRKNQNILLLATGILAQRYQQALAAFGFNNVTEMDADKALLAGQSKLFLQTPKP